MSLMSVLRVIDSEIKFPKWFRALRYFIPKPIRQRKTVAGFFSYSQASQDVFVQTLIDSKKTSTYVEIGANDPIRFNNTFILEKLGWSGVSFEIDDNLVSKFNTLRKNKCICCDATIFNYKEYFNSQRYPEQIDYLSIDIEPASQSLATLKIIPFNKYRFSIITFEHELSIEGPDVMLESREILASHGYTRVVSNVKYNGEAFEDWYVDPTIINVKKYQRFFGLADIDHANIFK